MDVDDDFGIQSEDELQGDEHTIEEDEALITREERKEELEALQDEMDLPLEELLKRYNTGKVIREGSPLKGEDVDQPIHLGEDGMKGKGHNPSAAQDIDEGSSHPTSLHQGLSNGNISIVDNDYKIEVETNNLCYLSLAMNRYWMTLTPSSCPQLGINFARIQISWLAFDELSSTTVQPIGNIAERFHALCLKDSGVLYEDPYIQIGIKAEWRAHHGRLVLFLGNKNTSPLVSVQALILPPLHLKIELSKVPDTIPPRAQVQCPLEVANLRPSRDVAVLDFSYKFGTTLINPKLRLPAVLNKFMQHISLTAEEFFPQWRSLSGPPLKLQEVVRGVKPLSLPEMANLFNSFQLMVSPGLDPNPNNLVASTTFYSENTRAMLCLVRVETDPSDRTQLRMTVASGDPALTFELKEFIKDQLVSIPAASAPGPPPPPPQPQPASPAAALSDPGAMLAGLL